MLPAAILALLAILPSSTATYVNCNIACRKCKDRTTRPSVREIYCAMCKECRMRLRERALRAYRRNLMEDGIIDVDGLEPDKPGIRFEDAGAANNDEAIINMGAPVDNLELIDELPGGDAEDGFLENTDVVKDDPDDKLIIQNDITQPTTDQTSTKPLLKPKTKQYRAKSVATTQAEPLDNIVEDSVETIIENAQEDIFGDSPQKVKKYPLDIPDGCPMPPICSDTEEEVEAVPSSLPTVPPTALPTTTTRPPFTCPPVPTCKPKRNTTTPSSNAVPCMPCMPWCSATCNNQNLTQWNMWNWNWPPSPNVLNGPPGFYGPTGPPGPYGPNGPPGPHGPNESTGPYVPNRPPPGSLSPEDSWQFPSEPPSIPDNPVSTVTPVPTTCLPLQMTCGPVHPNPTDSATMNLFVPTQTPTTTQDFIYVYVGVPKDVEKEK